MVRLGDVCRFINGDRGKNYPSQAEISSNGDIPFINAGHIVGGKLDFSEMNYISEKKYDQLNSGKVQENDILYCLRGSLGKKAIVKNISKAVIASSLLIIRPDSQILNSDYLFFALESPSVQEQMMQANNGSSQPNLSAKSVSDYTFYLPDIKDQLEVVAKLTKINNLIALREEQLAKLDELVKSRFIELFGDYRINEKGFDCKKGSELFKFSSGKFLPEEKRLDEGVPVYGGNGIAWYTSECLVDYPTIIIGRVGAQCGNIHAVTTPVWITDNAIYIKEQKTKAYTLEFLTELMRMMDFYQYADFSGQPKITQKPLETLDYIMPPIELQTQFVAFVEQTDKSKLDVQQSLNKLKLLKKALMQKYFG